MRPRFFTDRLTRGERETLPSIDVDRLWLTRAVRLLAPWRALTNPLFLGLEHVPANGPFLLVGNHTLLGVLDVPLLVRELFVERGVVVRGLGDHVHFRVPAYRDVLTRFGVVDGTHENADRLIRNGEVLMVFPGGAREVTKRRDEKYTLHWRRRTGFARLAIRHGCPIVPFAMVGAEEAFDIVFDGNDWLSTSIGKSLFQKWPRSDLLFPIVRGVGRTPFPRPVRLYFSFGPPIDTRPFGGDDRDSRAANLLRDEVKAAVEAQVLALRERQAHDPLRHGLFGALGRRANVDEQNT